MNCRPLFFVRENGVTVFPCAYGPGVFHRAYEYPSVSDFACVSRLEYGFDGRLHELVAANDGDGNARDDVSTVHHTAVNPLLPVLSDCFHFGIREPVDVGLKESLLDLLEMRLSDDGLDFFHNCFGLGNKKKPNQQMYGTYND